MKKKIIQAVYTLDFLGKLVDLSSAINFKRKRFYVLLCLMLAGQLFFTTTGYAQSLETKITFELHDKTLQQGLNELAKRSGFRVAYTLPQVSSYTNITVPKDNRTVRETLGLLLANTSLTYTLKGKSILVFEKARAKSTSDNSKFLLFGTVTDLESDPLPGVSVRVRGSDKGTITDENGRYSIEVEKGDIILLSYIGFNPREIMAKTDGEFNVSLTPNQISLSEVSVVSTGYQTLPKERATGSFGTISAKDLGKSSNANILQRIEGLVPGMQISLTGGDRSFDYNTNGKSISSDVRTVGATDYNVIIRGSSTFSGEKFPLLVVDGAISEMDISNFNPNDIENITVLKDAAAASIWGVRAANGVIVLTTKKGVMNHAPQINFSSSFMVADKPDLGYLKTMNSAQQLSYEKELVDRGFITSMPATSYYTAQYLMSDGTNLALKLKSGAISQSDYDAAIKNMSSIDNKSQINKYLLQPATSQQYNLSVSGGTNNSRYFYSTSYSNENPNIKGNSADRITLTLNNSWKLFNWATFSTNLKGTFFTYKNNGLGLSSLFLPSASTLMPYSLLADNNNKSISYARLDPTWTGALSPVYKDWTYNYLDELANADNLQKNDNYLGTINLQMPLLFGVKASLQYTLERTYSQAQNFLNQNTYYFRNLVNYYTYSTAANNSLGITNGGVLKQSNTNENNHSLRGQLDYDHLFNGIHQISALAGMEMRETNMSQSGFSLYGYNKETGFTNSNINYSNTPTYAYVAGSTPTSYTTFTDGGYPSQYDKRRRFLSYYSNVAYALLDRYSLSASVRYDDYNNFGLDRKYRATPLWSSGLKWILSKESFIQKQSWINNLAFRSSFGVNGNLSLSTYPFTNIGMSSSDQATGQAYATLIAMANPQLRWEKTYVTNLGLDFSLFSRRLNGGIDFYNKRGKDLLYSYYPISSVYVGTVAGGTLTRNMLSMNSKGVDLNLNGIVLTNKDWQWNVGGTFSYNTNKVTDARFIPSLYTSSYSMSPMSIGVLTGYPTDKLLVYRNAGLDANGLTQVYDEKGGIIKATTNTITSFDVFKNAGRTTAPFYGSFNTTLKYKQFSLYAFLTYQFGSVFLKPTISNYITSSYSTKYDLSADIANRWTKPGDEAITNTPGLNGSAMAVTYSQYRYQYSDINVLSGDYIRLRQISLNYELPSALMTKCHLKSAQLGFSVNNLGLLWTANKQGYDPDYVSSVSSSSYSLPASTSYTVSLNINL
ncbi:TonB-dependent receptor plug [Paludibacter propionicigenes WB4]|uniref:TonB-dependent receptor plug n=1 Tax=Paludibacter propionicigenes (strain DSM 17365 / JCM 13257 / WB4) TaxID=694427 RepID=E4T7F7_PALPW|nr:SusC/RagA family TonB-linked outer membrane protein [Paludibacter propionicigenes]ADQ80651.1 TonB-dependent receptor plug [Paludibacter propionicigenes WB4]